MILLKDVGDRIRATRNSKQMSQLELAEKINISASYMSDIEMGKSNFGVDILIRLAEVLQVSLDWLLRADVPESKEIIDWEHQVKKKSFELYSRYLVCNLCKVCTEWKNNESYRIYGEFLPNEGIVRFCMDDSVSITNRS